jgi:hypothetical protein
MRMFVNKRDGQTTGNHVLPLDVLAVVVARPYQPIQFVVGGKYTGIRSSAIEEQKPLACRLSLVRISCICASSLRVTLAPFYMPAHLHRSERILYQIEVYCEDRRRWPAIFFYRELFRKFEKDMEVDAGLIR